jgi:hypothetical protein
MCMQVLKHFDCLPPLRSGRIVLSLDREQAS